MRPAYVTFLKTGWWNSNDRTLGIHRCLHHNQKVVFRGSQRSSKYLKVIRNTLYITNLKSKGQKSNANCAWPCIHRKINKIVDPSTYSLEPFTFAHFNMRHSVFFQLINEKTEHSRVVTGSSCALFFVKTLVFCYFRKSSSHPPACLKGPRF